MAEQANPANAELSGSATPPGARLAAGIVAGTIGGIVMIGFMICYAQAIGAGATTPLKALGAFVYGVEALVMGTDAMLTGAFLQLAGSILLGILFGLFISRKTSTLATMPAGIIVGIVIWVAMDLFVLPYQNPTMAARIALMPLAYFAAHVLYGLALGMTPVFVRAFSRERHDKADRETRDHAHPQAAQTQSM